MTNEDTAAYEADKQTRNDAVEAFNAKWPLDCKSDPEFLSALKSLNDWLYESYRNSKRLWPEMWTPEADAREIAKEMARHAATFTFKQHQRVRAGERHGTVVGWYTHNDGTERYVVDFEDGTKSVRRTAELAADATP